MTFGYTPLTLKPSRKPLAEVSGWRRNCDIFDSMVIFTFFATLFKNPPK